MKLFFLFIVLSVAGCASEGKKKSDSSESKAVAEIHSATKKDLRGKVTIEDMPEQLKVTAEISGLKPNSKLGFHIHENGVCEGPTYESAGGHFNPHEKEHGRPHTDSSHLGDMGNLNVNHKGEAKQIIYIPKNTNNDFSKVIGKAIIIHAGTDDYKTQPAGDAGGRIACGLIIPSDRI